MLEAACDDFMRKPFYKRERFARLEQYLRVRFRYAEIINEIVYNEEATFSLLAATQRHLASSLSQDTTYQLPSQWKTAFWQAAQEGDFAWMHTLTEQITSSYPQLSTTRSQFIDNFEYDAILVLLDTIEKNLGAV